MRPPIWGVCPGWHFRHSPTRGIMVPWVARSGPSSSRTTVSRSGVESCATDINRTRLSLPVPDPTGRERPRSLPLQVVGRPPGRPTTPLPAPRGPRLRAPAAAAPARVGMARRRATPRCSRSSRRCSCGWVRARRRMPSSTASARPSAGSRMRRAVIFRYDNARRRVRRRGRARDRLEQFAGAYVTVESAPIARPAAARGPRDRGRRGRRSATSRGYLRASSPAPAGVRADGGGGPRDRRDPHRPAIERARRLDDERHLLWTLGKTAALASLARARDAPAGAQPRSSSSGSTSRARSTRRASSACSGSRWRSTPRTSCRRRAQRALRRARRRRRSATCGPRCSARSAATSRRDRHDASRPSSSGLRAPALGARGRAGAGRRRPCPPSSSRSPSRCSPRPCATSQKHPRDPHRVSLSSDDGNVRARGAQRRRRRAPRRQSGGWACGWRRSRRFRAAGWSSSASPTPGIWQVRLVVPIEPVTSWDPRSR